VLDWDESTIAPKGPPVPELAPLIWFADDWGRHPSSSQHIVRELLARRRVHWINTIGTRRPRFNFDTVQRGLEKLNHWTKSTADQTLPANLSVSNPRMWPWFSHGWDRRLNRILLTRHLRRLIAEMARPPVVVTTLPLMADLIGRVPAERWIYYCVDDFSVWPGLDGHAMRAMEMRLVAKVDCIVAVSEALRQRVKSMGRPSELLTHGVDLEFWRKATETSPAFESLTKPLITFWGVVDRRMDHAMVRALSEANLGTILLAGPHNEPDPQLLALPGVVAPGPLPLEQLPGLARLSSVLIMPYADLPVTRAMQPLKLKEYLATGLPCVVSDLPANREWSDCLDLAGSPEGFVAAVERRLVECVPEGQRLARQRLSQESWQEKALRFEQMIEGGGHG
jgi:glycosyltransferase involved in cell wall biosynthesis